MKTFSKGGVHPAENKIAANAPIEVMPIPKKAFIPVGQHLGAPAKPVVQKGDTIKVGTLLAKGESFISAHIHSSVSGKIEKIDHWIDASGYKRQMIIVGVEGDEWEESIDRTPEIVHEITLSKQEIIARIKESGIVGLGGATFPTHVKLMIPDGKKCDVLLINGVECEPYLTSDHRVMLERGEEM
ncbi:MAG: electron transporter RnfC, partial [Bacteroidales bacterium]|nr:electron transporter RnfC [Bacteroidales bacterium]